MTGMFRSNLDVGKEFKDFFQPARHTGKAGVECSVYCHATSLGTLNFSSRAFRLRLLLRVSAPVRMESLRIVPYGHGVRPFLNEPNSVARDCPPQTQAHPDSIKLDMHSKNITDLLQLIKT